MLGCEIGFDASNILIDVEFLQATLNCSLRDPNTNVIGNILERCISELKSNQGEVSVIAFGCGMLVLTVRTTLFELRSGVLKRDTK